MSSSKTLSGQSQNPFGTTGAEVVPLSRISIDTGFRDNADPSESEPKVSDFTPPIEVIPGQTRILLSEAASRHLSAQGAECFAIVAKASHPEQPGRWVIHLAPCALKTARDAEAVLFGKARAVKIKAPSKP